MKKLTVFSLATLLATALTFPALAGAATKHPAKPPATTTLRVTLNGVAKGNAASVLVTGPHFKRLINHSSVFTKVLPGTYHASPRNTKDKSGIEYASTRTSVAVRRDHTATLVANFDFVPTTTKVIAPTKTLSITGPSDGRQVLTISRPNALAAGDIAVSRPVAGRPLGYIVRVLNVRTYLHTSVATVVPASLQQAVPNGSYSMNSVLESLNTQLAAGPLHLARASHDTSASPCDGATGLTVTPSLSFNLSNAHADIESWDVNTYLFGHVHVPHNASGTLDITVNASLTVAATTSTTCLLSIPLAQYEGEPIPLQVGPVPVVITPSMGLTASGEVTSIGAIDASTSASITDSMYGKLIIPTFTNSLSSTYVAPSLSANASITADASLTADIAVNVDGFANASVSVGPELKFDATAESTSGPSTPLVPTPSWTLQGCLTAGFSLQVDPLPALSHTWDLLCGTIDQSASTPTTTTTTTTPSAPSTTTTTIPTVSSLPGPVAAVTYGGGRFVALGEPNSQGYTTYDAWSANGTTWHTGTLPPHQNWASIAYGAGHFVITSHTSSTKTAVIGYSPDGIHWSTTHLPPAASGTPEAYAVAYGGGRFVAILPYSNQFAYSTNAKNWYLSAPLSDSSLAPADWVGVAYGGGRFAVLSATPDHSGHAIWSAWSDNASTWHQSTTPFGTAAIAYGDGRFAAIAGYGGNTLEYSADGVHWTLSTMNRGGWWTGLTYGGGKFVALGTWPGGAEGLSSDGLTWTSGPLPGDATSWTAAAYGAGVYVITSGGAIGFLGSSVTGIIESPDATTWQVVAVAK